MYGLLDIIVVIFTVCLSISRHFQYEKKKEPAEEKISKFGYVYFTHNPIDAYWDFKLVFGKLTECSNPTL